MRITQGLEGTGRCRLSTGVTFFEHMQHPISRRGLIALEFESRGDIHIDDHHTNADQTNADQDIAFGQALAQALAQALGDRRGIHRFRHLLAPVDEARIQVALARRGRPHLIHGLTITAGNNGTDDSGLVRTFYMALADNAGLTLHLRRLDGVNSHHILEACCKAFTRALRQATEPDPRRVGAIPSSKGVLEPAGATGRGILLPERCVVCFASDHPFAHTVRPDAAAWIGR